ncbi:MAG: Fatty acid desaturase [Chlorobi bacterium OLB7]|nr:MAG: Fatty acid desaturase [Chlorobi bacterium OLB7]
MSLISERTRFRILNSWFLIVHLGCLLPIWTGVSWFAVGVCCFLYFIRMFGLTAGYHRYFSHRSYKTGRVFQFLMALLGASAGQNGPLWWAAKHRHHHRYSDTEEDVHSPITGSFWWSHMGWILSKKFIDYDDNSVRDLAKYPELRMLDWGHAVVLTMLGVGLFGLGELLAVQAPGLGTDGPQLLAWGFFISTTLLYHGVFTVNSLAHVWGSRRFNTTDQSRNNLFIALITLGEGWHNNHHRYMTSERQGFYWWEIDISHYMLTMLSWVGLVHDLRKPPQKIYDEARQNKHGIHLPELPSLPEIQEGISEGIEELAAAIKPRKPASERT